jgi:antitoxin component YwqK of YwqJK toxin-antitoxin module
MKNGIIKEYFENGNIKSINIYLNDKLHGLCQTFFENGNMESSWMFKDNI